MEDETTKTNDTTRFFEPHDTILKDVKDEDEREFNDRMAKQLKKISESKDKFSNGQKELRMIIIPGYQFIQQCLLLLPQFAQCHRSQHLH